jgi:hypothetical protein
MMKSLDIDNGSITLCVNQDMTRLLTFNPTDVNFASRFYELLDDFTAKENELIGRAKKIDEEMVLDENGVPSNIKEIFALTNELDGYFKERLDYVFGAGTSETCFGNVNVMSVDKKGNRILTNFIMGIAPYITVARDSEIKKHTAKYSKKNAK